MNPPILATRNLGLDIGGGGSTVPEGPVPDGSTNRLSITFHSSGIQTLAEELAQRDQEKSA